MSAKSQLSKAARGLANKLFGHAAERRAEKFLRRAGYEIIAANWACKYGEIDLIARKDGVLHFCEVKASAVGFSAEQYLRASKIPKLKRTIMAFMQANEHLSEHSICFDLLAISDDEVTHLENIYLD